MVLDMWLEWGNDWRCPAILAVEFGVVPAEQC